MSQPSPKSAASIPDPLPSHHKALVIESPSTLGTIQTRPLPTLPTHGSALVRLLACPVISYTRDIFQKGNPRKYTYPLPIVPGTSAIARVAAVSQDATTLKPGQLVLFDSFIRSRDTDASGRPAAFLSAIHDGFTEASKKLMREGCCRDGSYAEYMICPLENCFILDEDKLTGSPSPSPPSSSSSLTTTFSKKFNYTPTILSTMLQLLVPFGGLRSVSLSPGETVLISPATGPFGTAACIVALSLGARVIAWGRNTTRLAELHSRLTSIDNERYIDMLTTVPLTSDADADLANIRNLVGPGRGVDVFFDISPSQAQGSHHLKTGILTLRHGGRVSLMGGFREDVPIPHIFVMHFDITLKGKWMYDREDVVELIKMVETGVLKLGDGQGNHRVKEWTLDQWEQAWDDAAERTGLGEASVLIP